jgi:hypothetical protein
MLILIWENTYVVFFWHCLYPLSFSDSESMRISLKYPEWVISSLALADSLLQQVSLSFSAESLYVPHSPLSPEPCYSAT